MRKHVIRADLAALLAGTMAVACIGPDEGDQHDQLESRDGINTLIELDISENSDVEWLNYTVTKCEDKKAIYQSKRKLRELILAERGPDFINNRSANASKQAFAEHLLHLDTGCYDVHVQPLDNNNEESKVHSAAQEQEVEVEEGKTTDVLLVSDRKDGKKTSDGIPDSKHASKIVDLTYKSKHFVKCKEGSEQVQVQVCARATDKGGDPISFYWQQKSGPPIGEGQPVVDSFEQQGKVATECVTYTLPELQQGQANYLFQVSLFDEFGDDYHKIAYHKISKDKDVKDGDKKDKHGSKVKFPIRVICKELKDITLENTASVTSDEVDINPDTNVDTTAVVVKGYKKSCKESGKCCEGSKGVE